MKLKQLLVLSIIINSGTMLYGHPGHGSQGNTSSIQHYTTEPLHQLEWAGLVTIGIIAGYFVRRYISSRKQ